MTSEEIKAYLPKYLSDKSIEGMLKAFRKYPEIVPDSFYTNYLTDDEFYQGDGIGDMIFFNLPDINKKYYPCMLLSNSCDMDNNNIRRFPVNVLYAPIIKLDKYISAVKNSGNSEQFLSSHIASVKKQTLTNLFYLPAYSNIIEDSLVLLDRILNIPASQINKAEYIKNRIFSLSDYGFYFLLFKLSLHFSRMKEEVDRRSFLY